VLERRQIQSHFDRVAARYDAHAALEAEVGKRLLERCAFARRPPGRIVDLGCGTGLAAAALKRQFRQAQVIGLDASPAMLRQLRARSRWRHPLRAVCADIARLPFPYASIDLLFSNLSNYWSPDPAALLDEFRRVLAPDGMLLFTTLGPASLTELGAAAARLDSAVRMPVFADLLAVGDALVAAGFSEPVMDADRVTLGYPDARALLRELEATGASLLIDGWERLAAAGEALQAAYPRAGGAGGCPLSFEVVYGVAFGPQEGQPRRSRDGEVATFSVDRLLKSRRMG